MKELQKAFLSCCVEEGTIVTVFMDNGYQMHDVRILDADENTLYIAVKGGKQKLLYKHSVSTIQPDVPMDYTKYMDCSYDDGWISAAEPPKDDRMVLVWAVPKKGDGSVNRARYSDGAWHGSGSMAGVTHWAELPQPPEVST